MVQLKDWEPATQQKDKLKDRASTIKKLLLQLQDQRSEQSYFHLHTNLAGTGDKKMYRQLFWVLS